MSQLDTRSRRVAVRDTSAVLRKCLPSKCCFVRDVGRAVLSNAASYVTNAVCLHQVCESLCAVTPTFVYGLPQKTKKRNDSCGCWITHEGVSPSFKLTRYCRQRVAALGHRGNCPSAASRLSVGIVAGWLLTLTEAGQGPRER